MTEASVSFAGNLTDQPELRYADSGIARAMFRVAVSARREQEASFFTVIVWRDQAEHAAEVPEPGQPRGSGGPAAAAQLDAEDGSARSLVEVVAEELGPSNCGGRRPRRPGRQGARTSSQLDRRCDQRDAGSMLAFRSVAPRPVELMPPISGRREGRWVAGW
jgi:single-strand DNA-binding protein